MSTLPASDWVVPVPDWPGFRMFPQEPNVCGGANAVESHLGHVFSLFRGLWAAECVQISFMGPCGGPFLLVAVAVWLSPSVRFSGVAVHLVMVGRVWVCMT